MKKTNLLLAASIAAFLSGCGGGSTPATEDAQISGMSLPNGVVLTRDDDNTSSNLALVNFAAAGDDTDYENQEQKIWFNDGDDYTQLTTVNNILQIMSYTNAEDMLGKGMYKIIYDDPFDGQNNHEMLEAFIEVTRADNDSPMIVKFVEIDSNVGNNLDPEVRMVHVQVDKGVSTDTPMGEFKMTMLELEDDNANYASLQEWLTDIKTDLDPKYHDLTLKISSDTVTAGQTNVQFDMTVDGQNFGQNNSQEWYTKLHQAANIKTQGTFDSGNGWFLQEMKTDTDDGYSYFDELYPSFNEKYIADRVGRSAEGDTDTGKLSYRTEHSETHYEYKLFNLDESHLDLGLTISSFSFLKDDVYGYVWSTYDANSVNSGQYYFDGSLGVSDQISDTTGNTYTVSSLDTSNNLINLTNSNGNQVTVGGWSTVTIDGEGFYKSGDNLYPYWDNEDQLTDKQAIIIGNDNYIVKSTLSIKERANVGGGTGETNHYADLATLAIPADQAQVTELLGNLSDINLNTLPGESGLIFNVLELETTFDWYMANKDKFADATLRVVEGVTIEVE